MKKLGMPSGCVSTVTDNTLILYTFLAFAWIVKCPKQYLNYQSFEDHTAKALVGDDNTWTVSDDAHVFFNAVSVIDAWKHVGIIATTDSLTARPADELDFLSAHTVFIKGMAVPLYSRDKLMTALLFAPQSRITPATSLQRCTNLLQIGWTDVIYRNFCRAFIDWLLQEYDKVLKDDPRWIVAKSGIMSDEAYFSLFTNRKIVFQPQGYQEHEERLIKPDNEGDTGVMSNFIGPQNKPKSRNVRRRQRTRGPRKGNATANKARRNRAGRPARARGRGRGGMAGRMNARTASGIGATSFGSNKARTITVTNDEFIGAVTVANQPNFNVVSYAINPGQAATFPWLSQQARQWEKYTFARLEFYFKREVSEFAAAGAAGKVIMNVDFDAADGPPTTKQQMEDSVPHIDGMPCENITLVLPPKQMHPVSSIAKFVRTGGLPGGNDIKTYDVGNLNVATQGIPANSEVGELRVRYTCVFTVPVLESAVSAPANNQVAVFDSNGFENPVTGVAYTMLLATATANGIGAVNAAGLITLPVGNYLVDSNISLISNGGVITDMDIALFKNAGIINSTQRFTIGAGAAVVRMILSTDPAFVSSNGTDTVSVRFTNANAFTGGAGDAVGTIRIVAI